MSNQIKPIISTPFDVCAIITTYRPNDGFSDNVQRVHKQVALVVIVDDGDSPNNVARLHNWFSRASNVILHHNEANLGVAVALNKGISIARSKGYQWVLMLDDDTIIDPDMVKNLIESWNHMAGQAGKPVAIMGMTYRDSHPGKIEPCPTKGPLFVEKRGIVTSGSLMPMDVFDRVGPFREELFIDSVDYDFCMRARAKGFRVIKVGRVGMTHTLGHIIESEVFGLKLETTDHSAVRRYYLYRNSIVLAREYFRRDPLYAIAALVFQCKTLVLVLLLEKDRCQKICMMWRGVLDAWRHRLGKCAWSD